MAPLYFHLTKYEIGRVLDALDLATDAEWMRPVRQAEFEEIKTKIEEQLPGPPPCSTYAGYVAGCRCDDCRKANAAYMRDLRARRRSVSA